MLNNELMDTLRAILGKGDAKYEVNIPVSPHPSFEEISNQMRITQEIIMKEISEHVDKEILRLRTELGKSNDE